LFPIIRCPFHSRKGSFSFLECSVN
jgi:hypothetical protein